MQTQHDVFSNDLPTPNLPRRAVYTANSAASPQSKAPALDSQRLDRLDPLQRQRLENDAERAYRSEQELIKVFSMSFSDLQRVLHRQANMATHFGKVA